MKYTGSRRKLSDTSYGDMECLLRSLYPPPLTLTFKEVPSPGTRLCVERRKYETTLTNERSAKSCVSKGHVLETSIPIERGVPWACISCPPPTSNRSCYTACKGGASSPANRQKRYIGDRASSFYLCGWKVWSKWQLPRNTIGRKCWKWRISWAWPWPFWFIGSSVAFNGSDCIWFIISSSR